MSTGRSCPDWAPREIQPACRGLGIAIRTFASGRLGRGLDDADHGGELPPGWQKKVARGEVLDGDLYAASESLPASILDQLPVGPEGTSIRHIEDRMVRVMDTTGLILDVLNPQ